MRLSELEPRWIHPNVFAFRCPHCRDTWLACKNVPMSYGDQYEVFEAAFGPDWNMHVVPLRQDTAWTINGDFPETLSVTPSLDASASGHWHGHITDGEIR